MLRANRDPFLPDCGGLLRAATLPWIRVSPGAPYFETESGQAWTPIGHNDSVTWPHLADLLTANDRTAAYFDMLAAHGVTCLRLMLEYVQDNEHYFEQPVGVFNPQMVRTWDRLFALAERSGLRFLLTPFDTFFMWKRWAQHPYNSRNGGIVESARVLLTSPAARAAIKERLAFAIDRWSGSGALFGWDLWNEMHPAYAEDDSGVFHEVIGDLASFVRERELARYGRTHPITVSAFGPMLTAGFHSRELGNTTLDPRAADAIYRHPALDFATVHSYAHGTIDAPRNTVDAAIVMGKLTRAALLEIRDSRPYSDSEHGPIHTFKDQRRTLSVGFDDEYFRHLQWAHLASGGAGGGMRWPNRSPHVLTPGMHVAQRGLAAFLPLIRWPVFRRRNLSRRIRLDQASFRACGCGDEHQAVIWLVRRQDRGRRGRLDRKVAVQRVRIDAPGLVPGEYQAVTWDTEQGCERDRFSLIVTGKRASFEVPVGRDLAIALRPADWV